MRLQELCATDAGGVLLSLDLEFLRTRFRVDAYNRTVINGENRAVGMEHN